MANENVISISFSQQEKTDLEKAINDISTILSGKCKSLNPAQRRSLSRVRYEKEVWIDKVKIHMDQNAAKLPPYIDKAEFDRDYEAHKVLNQLLNIMETQFQLMRDTNLLLGYDLDINSLMFYRCIKTAARNNDQGATTIYKDLSQQYPGGGKKKAIKEAN